MVWCGNVLTCTPDGQIKNMCKSKICVSRRFIIHRHSPQPWHCPTVSVSPRQTEIPLPSPSHHASHTIHFSPLRPNCTPPHCKVNIESDNETMTWTVLFFKLFAYCVLFSRAVLSLFWEMDPMHEFMASTALASLIVLVGLRIIIPKLIKLAFKVTFIVILFIAKQILKLFYDFFAALFGLTWLLILLSTPLWLQNAVSWTVQAAAVDVVIRNTVWPRGARRNTGTKKLGPFLGWSRSALSWSIAYQAPKRAFHKLYSVARKVIHQDATKAKKFISSYTPSMAPIIRFLKLIWKSARQYYNSSIQTFKTEWKEAVSATSATMTTLWSSVVEQSATAFKSSVALCKRVRTNSCHAWDATRRRTQKTCEHIQQASTALADSLHEAILPVWVAVVRVAQAIGAFLGKNAFALFRYLAGCLEPYALAAFWLLVKIFVPYVLRKHHKPIIWCLSKVTLRLMTSLATLLSQDPSTSIFWTCLGPDFQPTTSHYHYYGGYN